MPDVTSVRVSSLPVIAKISIPGAPDWMAIAPDAVWVSNGDMNNVARVDPNIDAIVATVAVGQSPCCGLAAGFGSVWAPCCGDRRVDRIDQATNRVTAGIATAVGDREGGIAADATGIWMITDTAGTLACIDPASNRIVAEVVTAPGSFVPAAGAGALWVTCTARDLLLRVDPQARAVTARIPVGPSPRFLAVADDAVWTLNQGDGTVSRVDPRTNALVATIETGIPAGPGGDIAVGEGFVWIAAIGIPVTKIDPSTNKVVAQFVARGGDAVRVGHGSVWLCSFILKELWRIDPNF
jgi:virginiamycin B lyase